MFNTEIRGQVGIGTLIVFMAMVLVAAIAAGVLIDTASSLEQQASQTGEETIREVSHLVEPQSIQVESPSSSRKIDTLNVTHNLVAGADAIDIRNSTWTIQAGDNATTVGYDDISSATSSGNVLHNVTGVSQKGVLKDQSSTIMVEFKLDDATTNSDDGLSGVRSIGQDEEVRVTINAPSGGQIHISDRTPKSIEKGKSSYY